MSGSALDSLRWKWVFLKGHCVATVVYLCDGCVDGQSKKNKEFHLDHVLWIDESMEGFEWKE